MHSDRQFGLAHLAKRATIEIRKRGETPRIAADNCQHHRQAVMRRTHDGLRRSADSDPGHQAAGFRLGIDVLIVKRRPRPSPPGDRLLREYGGEKIELLVEQVLVLVKVEAKQRERFYERAAAQDDLGTAARYRVQG